MECKFNKLSDNVIDNIYLNRELTQNIVDEILNADDRFWEDTHNYTNMNKAFNCMMDSIENNELIGIVIDPDTDGFLSAAELFMFIYDDLKYENVEYILHEDVKSHGIDKDIVNKVKEKDIKLLMTPDAGSSDKKQHKNLHEMGVKFIALDHHDFDFENTYEHAIIVSNQDEKVNNVDGSGALVTYKFIDYCCEELNIDIGYKYMDLVNIANIADMRDMVNLENRYFYNIGKKICNMSNKLLLAFASNLKRNKYITIENVQFGISNKINALIRNGTQKEKEDLFEALIGTEEIVEYKYKGKIRKQSLQDAVIRYSNRLKNNQKDKIKEVAEIETFTKYEDKVLIVNGENIPKEVRGLMCNQLSKQYCRPILIVKKTNKGMEGSCRGYTISNFKGLCDESGLFYKLEGHPGAFGCGINEENIPKFIEFINIKLKDEEFDNTIIIDFEYNKSIPIDDLKELGKIFELWCNEIKKPNLLIRNVVINTEDISKGRNYFSFKINGIHFRKDFVSNEFFNNMIHVEDNKNKDKDLKMDILCTVKRWESELSYIDIIDCKSEIFN